MTTIIDNDALERLARIANHPLAGGATVETLVSAIMSENLDPHSYCDILEMQLGVLTVVNRFRDRQTDRGEPQAATLCAIGVCFGSLIGRMTHDDPIEGREVASTLGQMIADRFNESMVKWFAWRETPPPKTPTHELQFSLN